MVCANGGQWDCLDVGAAGARHEVQATEGGGLKQVG